MAELLATTPPETADAIVHDWQVWARDNQLTPPGRWWVWWLVLAGRGFGKTRMGAQYILARVASGEARRIALVGPTAADVRDTMIETGPSSLLKIAPRSLRPRYEPSKRRLTFPNGAVATAFSADEPERLRGPQHDTAWCDELCAWKYLRETWDQIAFGFREGTPQGIITTTPRPSPVLAELLADARGESPTVVVTRGSTYDNLANLAPTFARKILRRYEGTRIGRQELLAEVLDDTPGALWTDALIERNRVAEAPALFRIGVAIDPQAAAPDPNAANEDEGGETGIVAGGIDAKGDGYVLADESGHYSPGEWGERAVLLHDRLRADFIVAEDNQGGAMVEHVVRTAAEKLYREKKRPSPHVVVRRVHASRGKHTRAEPIAALDEQGRTHHVGVFARMESQMTTWVPGEKSPDRLDARVWLFTELMLEGSAPAGDEDFERPAPPPARSVGGYQRGERDRDEDDDPWAVLSGRREDRAP